MKSKTQVKLSALALVAVFAAFGFWSGHAASADSQQPQQQQPAAQGTQTPAPANQQAQQEPKNVQILKGLSRPDIIARMRAINQALGVECNFCHTNPFETDTPRKLTTRLMMRDYVMEMKHKDGKELTCNDCHKGQPNFLRTRAFENLITKKVGGRQVLRGMSDDKVMEVMTAFTKALGVECNYCHTDDFDQDTPRKQIARFMMTEFSGGLVKKDGSAVTCNDCHKGKPRPLAVFPFPRRENRPQQPAPAAEPKKPGE